jgi:Ser-tRNA(Ala) deacylase AlaX
MQLDGREDLMLPCGGTHATNTAQIGRITIRKVTYKQAKGTVKFAYAVLPNDEVEPKLVY